MSLRRIALVTALAGVVALTLFALLRGREQAARGPGRPASAAADSTARAAAVAGAHILIAHRDGRPALPGVTRTPDEARTLAVRLAAEILDNRASFAELARRYSDDARTARHGGDLGIVQPGRLPLSLEMTLTQLEVGGIAPCIESDAGFHVLMRVPVRRAVARHVLIGWRGSGADGGTITRSRTQAQTLAGEIAAQAQAPGADFCELAARYSDDEQSRFECGLIGLVEPGNLEAAFEDALVALPPGGISGVVESTYGYHVVKRDPELPRP
jgi:peptidyl-prolyl cis-trans isomerase SurA